MRFTIMSLNYLPNKGGLVSYAKNVSEYLLNGLHLLRQMAKTPNFAAKNI